MSDDNELSKLMQEAERIERIWQAAAKSGAAMPTDMMMFGAQLVVNLDYQAKNGEPLVRLWDLVEHLPHAGFMLQPHDRVPCGQRHHSRARHQRSSVHRPARSRRAARQGDGRTRILAARPRCMRRRWRRIRAGASASTRSYPRVGCGRTTARPPIGAALIEWFELNHPAEAKRITAEAIARCRRISKI